MVRNKPIRFRIVECGLYNAEWGKTRPRARAAGALPGKMPLEEGVKKEPPEESIR